MRAFAVIQGACIIEAAIILVAVWRFALITTDALAIFVLLPILMVGLPLLTAKWIWIIADPTDNPWTYEQREEKKL